MRSGAAGGVVQRSTGTSISRGHGGFKVARCETPRGPGTEPGSIPHPEPGALRLADHLAEVRVPLRSLRGALGARDAPSEAPMGSPVWTPRPRAARRPVRRAGPAARRVFLAGAGVPGPPRLAPRPPVLSSLPPARPPGRALLARPGDSEVLRNAKGGRQRGERRQGRGAAKVTQHLTKAARASPRPSAFRRPTVRQLCRMPPRSEPPKLILQNPASFVRPKTEKWAQTLGVFVVVVNDVLRLKEAAILVFETLALESGAVKLCGLAAAHTRQSTRHGRTASFQKFNLEKLAQPLGDFELPKRAF